MRISVLPVSFFATLSSGEMSFGECARIVAEAGAEGLDLSPVVVPGSDRAVLRRVRAEIEAVGITVRMLVAYPDFANSQESVRGHELDRLVEHVRLASELGAQFVRLTAGQAHPTTSREDGIRWVVEGLLAALEAGRAYGIDLVFENHSKPVVWELADFAYPAEVFHEIACRTEGTGLGILFDTANPVSRGDDPLKVLLPVVKRVRYVHASDTRAVGVLDPVVLGTGAVPFRPIFACLKQNGYDGWVSVEEASRTGHKAVSQGVSFVRQAWQTAF